MPDNQTKAERTRQFIIERTADLFNQQGYAGTSVSDLTKATGLSKGSIYGNFGSKEDVAIAAFEYNRARLMEIVRKEVEAADSYREKLLAFARAYKKLIRTSPVKGGCPILNTAIDSDDDNAFLKPALNAALEAWQKGTTDILKAGAKAGEFRDHSRQKQFAISMIALIEGGVMISRATNDLKKMDAIIETLEDLIRLEQK